ncbi:nuclear transport factor 2 family protein [Haloarcula sp. Atlit-7R]|uniref:nuclear transport factor 2 family protein n=1 Tax=Haloarcula sp. Atlit-7R TaxID=2282125 RepID=UPI000EF14736|nr:nuclear transport factor 2 family protein [Haloarcula sp. Atlit-7R]RLM89464.1 nuclear transport factor 2 family protein [Haloarcula sp. Atlit-7R]
MGASPSTVVKHVVEAQNDHDPEGMLEWIAPDYQTETPVHPERNFTGHDQVRETWETVFRTTPDFEATLLNMVEDGATVWTEFRYSGTQLDGTPLDMWGVIIFDVEDSQLARGRVYLEPSEAGEETWQDVYEVDGEDGTN